MKDNKKINKTRKSRGYAWEDAIVKRFSVKNGMWSAFRLGGASTHLPDIFVINNQTRTVVAIEAKSSTTNMCRVPAEQIARCRRWVNNFSLYDNQKVVLAFKFSAVCRNSLNEISSRKKREYFCVWDSWRPVTTDCTCDYEGRIYKIRPEEEGGGGRIQIELKEWEA